MWSALGTVEHDLCPNGARSRNNMGNIGQGAGHIRAMRQRDQPTAIGEFCFQPIEVESSLLRHRQEPQGSPTPFREFLPRYQIAVMLEDGKQDLVARFEKMRE